VIGGAERILAEHGKTVTRMEQPAKTCPKCGSGVYAFRSRKKVADESGTEAVETKYRCKGCKHEWKVKVAPKGTNEAR
jgi:DNA-directed RNA polymerase subunit M/transcription elongation factor TFIIS